MANQQFAAPLVVLAQGNERHVSVIRSIDGHDGHERWRFETERDHFVPMNALAADGGVVYAATAEGLAYALSAVDGALIWQRRVAVPHPDNRRPGDLRVVAGGGVMAVNYMRPELPPANTRHVTLLDGQNGSELWVWHPPRYSLGARLWQMWRQSNEQQRVGFVLLGVDRQGVYVTTASERHPPSSERLRTILLHRMSGNPQWRARQAAAANYAGHWGSRTSIALANNTAYTVGERISALDSSNGRARWSRPIPSDEGVRPGPLVADESVLCAAYDRRFCVYRVSDGELLWQLASGRGTGQVNSFLGMVLMDDAVYVSRNTFRTFGVEAHDALSGDLRWEWPRPDASSESASLARGDISWRFVGAGGVLYVPGPTSLCAVRASDGELLWQLPKVGGLPPLVAVAG